MLGRRPESPQVSGDRKISPLEAHRREGHVDRLLRGGGIGRGLARPDGSTRRSTQFLEDVAWGELDFLIIDLPPGTGDVSMTLAQLLPQSKFLIVTTPQPPPSGWRAARPELR